jgi:hypothetical protein
MTQESKTAEQLSEMIVSAMGHRGCARRRVDGLAMLVQRVLAQDRFAIRRWLMNCHHIREVPT